MPQKSSEHHSQPCLFHNVRVVKPFIAHIINNFWNVIEINVRSFGSPPYNTHAIVVSSLRDVDAFAGFGEVLDYMANVGAHKVCVEEELAFFVAETMLISEVMKVL